MLKHTVWHLYFCRLPIEVNGHLNAMIFCFQMQWRGQGIQQQPMEHNLGVLLVNDVLLDIWLSILIIFQCLYKNSL